MYITCMLGDVSGLVTNEVHSKLFAFLLAIIMSNPYATRSL
jgi:hypothetical protein